jgi:hypothetical protein
MIQEKLGGLANSVPDVLQAQRGTLNYQRKSKMLWNANFLSKHRCSGKSMLYFTQNDLHYCGVFYFMQHYGNLHTLFRQDYIQG